MKPLKPEIEKHGILTDNYYLPALKLSKDKRPIIYQSLLLSGRLYTILADLNEQSTERCHLNG